MSRQIVAFAPIPETHRMKKIVKVRHRISKALRNRHKQNNLRSRCEIVEIPRRCASRAAAIV